MISISQIEELSFKWRTTPLNAAREYVQHVILSALFGGIREEVNLAFKGGTALRILYHSPRFSEDLDFTGWGKPFHAGRYIALALKEAGMAGLSFNLTDSKSTSGGWFAASETFVHQWPVRVEWNISIRETSAVKTDTILVTSPLWTPYSVKALCEDEMAREKIEALIRRKESRDFFDIYYFLRQRLGLKQIVKRKSELIKHINALNPKAIEKELKQFLPSNQWPLIKQLPCALKQEIERL